MNTYTSLLQLISDLEELKLDQSLPIEKIESRFIEAMEDKMVLDYQEVLSTYTDINESIITEFDKDTILAFLTSVIRTERFMEGTLPDSLRSGLVLNALKKLAVLVNTEHRVMLNDILRIKDLDNVKVRLNFDYGPANWNVIEAFKNGDTEGLLNGHYWNYKGKKSYKKNQTTIGLLRISPKGDLWLLFHIGRVTKDLDLRDAMGYEFESLIEYNKFIGRVIVKYKNTSQAVIRNASSFIDQCEVYQILPDIFDNDIFPGYDNVNVSWKELSRVIEKESWKTALQNQKAVYLITDINNGKMYVGSASGQYMLLNRWQCYVDNGHGGNIELKKLSKDYIEENFRYSILDMFKSKTDDQIILSRASWWKNTLLTRKFGYNAN